MNINTNYQDQREALIESLAEWAEVFNRNGFTIVGNDFDGFDITNGSDKRWSGVRIAYEGDQLSAIQFVNGGGEYRTHFTGLVSKLMLGSAVETYISDLKVGA